jgi:hypothetical protein
MAGLGDEAADGDSLPQLVIRGLGSPNTKPWMYLQDDP